MNESDINIHFQSEDTVTNEILGDGSHLSDSDKDTVIGDESDINASQSDDVPSSCGNKNKSTNA